MQEKTAELYKDEVYKVVENRNSVYDRILNWEYLSVIKKINSFKPLKGRLLDFGCGKGKFGSLATGKGWELKCVETAEERASYAREIYGLTVNSNFYSTGKIFDEEFEVLVMFHVLEHLPDPKNLMEELILHNLKNDALVVIEVPNFRSWQRSIAGRRWMHLDPSRHISHFTPKRLNQFAREEGLVPLRTTYYSFHLGVLGMTDSILKVFGYRQNIIYRLKNKKDRMLVLFVLPFAFVIEALSVLFHRGGIVRKYFIRESPAHER